MGHLFLLPEQVHRTCVLVFLHQLLISGQGPTGFVGQLDSVRAAGLQAVVMSRCAAEKGRGGRLLSGDRHYSCRPGLVMESLKRKTTTAKKSVILHILTARKLEIARNSTI